MNILCAKDRLLCIVQLNKQDYNIYGNEKLVKRLLALGCISNTEIEVKKIAPLGDPIVVRFRGFDLALRKSDAKNISLK